MKNYDELFQETVKGLVGPLEKACIRECYGVSNSAKFVKGGFLCGIPNLDSLDKKSSSLCVFSKIQLTPASELHIAVVIRANIAKLLHVLETMVDKASEGFFADKNNNCALFFAPKGNLYAYNKAKQTFDLTSGIIGKLEGPIKPDAVYWTVYGSRGAASQETVAELKSVVGADLLIDPTLGSSSPQIPESITTAFRAVCDFCAAHDASREPWLTNRPACIEAKKNLGVLESWLRAEFETFGQAKLRFKSSSGAANFPKVPWICILPVGQEPNDGVYVSICFDKKGRGAVAGFAESSTNPKGLPVIKRTGKELKIDVDGSSAPTHFNDGFVNPEEFFKDSFDAVKLRDHLAKSLDLCLDHMGVSKLSPMAPDDKNNFVTQLEKCGFVAGEGLSVAFLQSLIAKPFVILTGNSGTGKTKIAELLAVWLRGPASDGHELVAVGADWTDNRNVVGFVNYLRFSGDKKAPIYQSTHLLDLLMRAGGTPRKPFFLILDEMNLSHVERYFADFLSAMESKGAALGLHSEGSEGELLPLEIGGKAVVPRKLAIPENVFVIGTVNVDETTYMFSPKVLDRANVIEFRMPDEAVKLFLEAGETKSLEIEYGGEGVAERFLSLSRLARADQLDDPADEAAVEKLTAALGGVFNIMRDARLEFGFRTINEIRRYVRVDYALTNDKSKWSWVDAFDAQLLQKILPKLNGSRRRLEDLLVRLTIFCESGKVPPLAGNMPAHLQSVPVKRQTAVFKNSYRKLCDMLDAVRRDQFVSFIH
jgi:5-methylcytosine-specific restriction protein B